MSTKKIIVPIDFSAQSKAALEYAGVFAKLDGAELLVVHVIDPLIQDLKGFSPDETMVALYEALHDLKPVDESVTCAHQILEGPTAKTIVELAKTEDADMIVMGTHGRTGMKRMVMGSVAESVVRNANCPVLTLRDPSVLTDAEPQPEAAKS